RAGRNQKRDDQECKRSCCNTHREFLPIEFQRMVGSAKYCGMRGIRQLRVNRFRAEIQIIRAEIQIKGCVQSEPIMSPVVVNSSILLPPALKRKQINLLTRANPAAMVAPQQLPAHRRSAMSRTTRVAGSLFVCLLVCTPLFAQAVSTA